MIINLFCVAIFFFNFSYCHVSYQPEQVHLAFGSNVSEIIVTWSTRNDTTDSIVEYGIGGFVLTATGTSELFVDGGSEKHSQYIHRVVLSGLTPSSKYGMNILFVLFLIPNNNVIVQCIIAEVIMAGPRNFGSIQSHRNLLGHRMWPFMGIWVTKMPSL